MWLRFTKRRKSRTCKLQIYNSHFCNLQHSGENRYWKNNHTFGSVQPDRWLSPSYRNKRSLIICPSHRHKWHGKQSSRSYFQKTIDKVKCPANALTFDKVIIKSMHMAFKVRQPDGPETGKLDVAKEHASIKPKVTERRSLSNWAPM